MHASNPVVIPTKKLIFGGIIAIFITVLFRTAWLSDDAYITFRTLDNLANGSGLVWNVAERAQSFTHPLWLFLLTPFRLLSGEIYFTSLFVAMGVSLIAFILALSTAKKNIAGALAVGALLLSSKAFIDYSTSGLENPLSHLLLALGLITYLLPRNHQRRLFYVALVTGLAATTRHDLILVFAPILIATFLQENTTSVAKKLGTVALGLLPIILWTLFSLFYYGFPFPNTFYAKLGGVVPSTELLKQGFWFFLNSLSIDPITVPAIVLFTALPFITKDRRLIPFSIGGILYMLYILKIGGDFMSGRFLTVPFFLAVLIFGQYVGSFRREVLIGIALLAVFVSYTSPLSSLFSNKTYGETSYLQDGFGIADERGAYYTGTGLLRVNRKKPFPDYPIALEGTRLRSSGIEVTLAKSVGFIGYNAGKEVHIIDELGLADPLLSRLEPTLEKNWRPGHLVRQVPCGYFETIESGENKICDPSLKMYYDRLSLITQGDLFSWERIRAIVGMQLGRYDHLLTEYEASK